MKKILVTPRSISENGHPALQVLCEKGFDILMPWPGRQPSEAELLSVLPECSGYLAGVEPISAKVIAQSKLLKIISRNGIGVDNVDLKAAKNAGIVVKGTPGANSEGVAELALADLLNLFRSISASSQKLKSGKWERTKGTEFQGKTLGIIGCGQIGYRLAKMALGIGMEVIGYDLYPSKAMAGIEGFRFVSVEEIQKNADAISLHCPPAEKPIVSDAFLAACKDGILIVNTARGQLVDNKAMLSAIKSGKVGGFATDVYLQEPPVLDELYLNENVTMTAHIGGFTKESVDRATIAAIQNIVDVLC